VYDFNFYKKRMDHKLTLTNIKPIQLGDASGELFHIMHQEFKPAEGYDQDIVIQYHFKSPGVDLTMDTDNMKRDSVFSLKLFKEVSCPNNDHSYYPISPCLENIYETSAPAVSVGKNSYQVTLNIPKDKTSGTLYLQLKPYWYERQGENTTQKALDTDSMQIATFANRVYYDSMAVFIQCSGDEDCEAKMENTLADLPSDVSSYSRGDYSSGDLRFNVYTNTDPTGSWAGGDFAAVVVGSSPLEVSAIEHSIFENNTEVKMNIDKFRYDYFDGLNNLTGKYEVRFNRKVTYLYKFLESGGDLEKEIPAPARTKIDVHEDLAKSHDNAMKVQSGGQNGFKQGTKEYTIEKIDFEGFDKSKLETTKNTEHGFVEHFVTKENFNTFADLKDKFVLENGVGAVIVTDGVDAFLAFKEGDEIKGIKASVKVVGSLAATGAEKIVVAKLGEQAGAKVGPIATAATGMVIAGIDIYQATQADNPFDERKHLEAASATLIDTAVAIMPYGWVVDPSWKAAVMVYSYFMPNRLAEKVCSSFGTGTTFVIEYFAGDVPTALSEEATLWVGEVIQEDIVDYQNDLATSGESDKFYVYFPPG